MSCNCYPSEVVAPKPILNTLCRLLSHPPTSTQLLDLSPPLSDISTATANAPTSPPSTRRSRPKPRIPPPSLLQRFCKHPRDVAHPQPLESDASVTITWRILSSGLILQSNELKNSVQLKSCRRILEKETSLVT